MPFVVKVAATFFAGIALGLAATWLAVGLGVPRAVSNGPWATNLSIGSPASDPYTRAAVALHGLFALNRSETIYYLATNDSEGERLNGACTYRIEGRDPTARWWSITAYGDNEYLIPNPTDRYSVDKANAWRTANHGFSVVVGTKPQSSSWIPVTNGNFSLVLRLFNPGPAIALAPGRALLPSIRRVGCS